MTSNGFAALKCSMHGYRATLVLAFPLIISNLSQAVKHLTDVIMLGWYGVEELAAVVLGTTLWAVLFIIGSGWSMAVITLASRAAGEGSPRWVRRYVRMGCWLAILFCIVVSPFLWSSGSLLILLEQQQDISMMAQSYLRIAMWGLYPALLVMTLKSFFLAVVRPNVILWSTLSGAALNILLNYILIFGRFGLPELGITGAAIATVTAHVFTLVLMLLAISSRHFRVYRLLKGIWRPCWATFGELFMMGWPVGMALIAESAFFGFSAIMAGWIDTSTLAAHGIVVEIAAFVFMVYLGLANAGSARIGRATGRRDRCDLVESYRSTIHLTLCMVILVMLAFLLLPEFIVSAFLNTASPDSLIVLGIGVGLLFIAALFQLADAMQVVMLGLLRGLGDTRTPMIIAGFSYLMIGIPCSYALGFIAGWGIEGIWAGFIIGLGLAAIMFYLRFRRKISELPFDHGTANRPTL